MTALTDVGQNSRALRASIRRWRNAPKRRLYERLYAEHTDRLAVIGVANSPMLRIYADRIKEFS